jgi:hypothetical protein
MRLDHHMCTCAFCDFDRKMQEQLGRKYDKAVLADFHPEDINLPPTLFALNMEEYANVWYEDAGEWTYSYH